MTYRILQSALLCMALLLLSGCAVYEVDRGYSAERYPSYSHQRAEHADSHYRHYPAVENSRYSPRVQPVQVYRRPIYHQVPAPRWIETGRYRVAEKHYRDHNNHHEARGRGRGEHYERDQRHGHAYDRYRGSDRDREQRRDHDGDHVRDREQRRGWEAQRN